MRNGAKISRIDWQETEHSGGCLHAKDGVTLELSVCEIVGVFVNESKDGVLKRSHNVRYIETITWAE